MPANPKRAVWLKQKPGVKPGVNPVAGCSRQPPGRRAGLISPVTGSAKRCSRGNGAAGRVVYIMRPERTGVTKKGKEFEGLNQGSRTTTLTLFPRCFRGTVTCAVFPNGLAVPSNTAYPLIW